MVWLVRAIATPEMPAKGASASAMSAATKTVDRAILDKDLKTVTPNTLRGLPGNGEGDLHPLKCDLVDNSAF